MGVVCIFRGHFFDLIPIKSFCGDQSCVIVTNSILNASKEAHKLTEVGKYVGLTKIYCIL